MVRGGDQGTGKPCGKRNSSHEQPHQQESKEN